jgi:hypothetical protein
VIYFIQIISGQVNKEIDDLEDLLAVETINEINPQLVEILPAPPGFGGQRLTAKKTAAKSNKNQDGTYSFR